MIKNIRILITGIYFNLINGLNIKKRTNTRKGLRKTGLSCKKSSVRFSRVSLVR